MWYEFMDDLALAKKLNRAKHAGKDKTYFKNSYDLNNYASTPGTYDGCYTTKDVQA